MGGMDRPAPLVLGAAGMLGAALGRRLDADYPDTVAATRAEIDIEDRFRMEAEFERLRPSVVINCAAFTDVDRCEAAPELAHAINAEGAENVARIALASGCRMIHVSTDFVFDGHSDRPYVEEDPTGPLSVYGKSKLEGERRVAATGGEHLIVRSSWIYGPGRANFVDAIRARARAGGVLEVVEDQIGSPTYVADLAEAITRLIGTDHRGIVHFANAGLCSRYELAREILESMGRTRARVEPIRTSQAGRIAARPARSALDTSLYSRLTGHEPRHWRAALLDYLGRPIDEARDA
jgi:dTDP-4-dehydrorhamnose reductase